MNEFVLSSASFGWKSVKAFAAIVVYALALCTTFVGESLFIQLSYVFPHETTVFMWAGFVLVMTGVWAFTGWGILALWQKRKRDDAHLVLLPLSFMAVSATAALSLFAAAAALWSPSVYAALAWAVIITAGAGWTLHFLIRHAVMAWQGKHTFFV